MPYQTVELGREQWVSVDDYIVTAKLQQPVGESDITQYVIEELQKYLAEVCSWNPPTFDDLERIAGSLKILANNTANLAQAGKFERSVERGGVAYSGVPVPELVSGLWTAAQVAATSIALGAAIANGSRKWRQRSLPEGSRLTLTITPSKSDDQRKQVKIVIYDMHTKSVTEITEEIRRTLNKYAQSGDSGSPKHQSHHDHPQS